MDFVQGWRLSDHDDAVRGGVATLPAGLNRKLNRTFLSREADIESLFFDNFETAGTTRWTATAP